MHAPASHVLCEMQLGLVPEAQLGEKAVQTDDGVAQLLVGTTKSSISPMGGLGPLSYVRNIHCKSQNTSRLTFLHWCGWVGWGAGLPGSA